MRHLLAGLTVLFALTSVFTLWAQDDGENEKLKAWFDTFRKVIEEGTEAEITDEFDTARMFDEIRGIGMAKGLTPDQEKAFQTGLGLGIGRSFVQNRALLTWKRHEIRKVRADGPNRTELTVTLRTWDADGFSSITVWYLRKYEEDWRAFDFEDLTVGARATALMGPALAGNFNNVPAWVKTVPTLTQALLLANSEEYEAARQVLTSIANVKYPDMFAVQKQMVEVVVCIGEDRLDAAVNALEEADTINKRLEKEMPGIHFLAAVVYNLAERYEDAIQRQLEFAKAIGWTGDGWNEMGIAYEGLGKTKEAISAYRTGLLDTPESVDMLYGLARVLSEEEMNEIGKRFLEHPSPEAVFSEVCQWFYTWEPNQFALAAVVSAFEEKGKDTAEWYSWKGEVLAGEGDLEGLQALAEQGLESLAGEEREYFQWTAITWLCDAGEYVKAYNLVPGPGGFYEVATNLWYIDDAKNLEHIINLHKEEHPDDGWLHYFSGCLAYLKLDLDSARGAFKEGMAAGDEDLEYECRHQLTLMDFRAGNMEELNKVLDLDLFYSLVSIAGAENLTDSLGALIDSSDDKFRSTEVFRFAEAMHLYLKKEYDALADRSSKLLPVLQDSDYLWDVEDLVIRAQFRAGRLEDLKALAGEIGKRDYDHFYDLFVHALAGDAEAMTESAEAVLSEGYVVEDIVDDEDLGPVVAKPEFEAVRALWE